MDSLRRALEPLVRSGVAPGMIVLVARGDDAQVAVIGHKAFDDPVPLQRTDLFRIGSISKPIVAAGALALRDAGLLDLDAPVDAHLPELADRRVLRALDAALDDTVPAVRPITATDLLTGRMGFGIPMRAPDSLPIQRAEAARGLATITPPRPPTRLTTDEWLARLGELPLMAQPGTEFHYHSGIQVLGALIERIEGKPWFDAVRQRVLEPLGMHDTMVHVNDLDRARFTTAYTPDPVTGAATLLDPPSASLWRDPLPFPNAGAWIVSTVDDLWRFVGMLRSGGGSVLHSDTVSEMTTNQLTPDQMAGEHAVPILDGGGWGFGLAIDARGYGWDGGTGTSWRMDPSNDTTGILLTQREFMAPPLPIYTEFWDWMAKRSGL